MLDGLAEVDYSLDSSVGLTRLFQKEVVKLFDWAVLFAGYALVGGEFDARFVSFDFLWE